MKKTKNLPDFKNCTIENNFTQIPNEILRNPHLSYKAKGLICTLLSNQSGWKSTIKGLAKISSDSSGSVRSGLKELEQHGYLLRLHYREIHKKQYVGYIWLYTNVPFTFIMDNELSDLKYEIPKNEIPEHINIKYKNPASGNPDSGNRYPDNTKYSSTKYNNTKYNDTKKVNIKYKNPGSGFPESGFPESGNRYPNNTIYNNTNYNNTKKEKNIKKRKSETFGFMEFKKGLEKDVVVKEYLKDKKFSKLVEKYFDMRKEINDPIKSNQATSEKRNKFKKHTLQENIEAISKSIERKWKGIFFPDNDETPSRNKTPSKEDFDPKEYLIQKYKTWDRAITHFRVCWKLPIAILKDRRLDGSDLIEYVQRFIDTIDNIHQKNGITSDDYMCHAVPSSYVIVNEYLEWIDDQDWLYKKDEKLLDVKNRIFHQFKSTLVENYDCDILNGKFEEN